MKINLTEMMRIKLRLSDIDLEMENTFSGINNEFNSISNNIKSYELQKSILKFQNTIMNLSKEFSRNNNYLEEFLEKQLTEYSQTNEEASASLKYLIMLLDETFSPNGNNLVGEGKEIAIPSSVKQTGLCPNYTSYSYFYGKWNDGTMQKEIADKWGESGKPSANGIATLNDRYLVAVSPKFGKVGDDIDVVLNDGQVINATIADMKGTDATSEWGHVLTDYGAVDIIEWEASGAKSDIDLGSWRNVSVDKIVNLNEKI